MKMETRELDAIKSKLDKHAEKVQKWKSKVLEDTKTHKRSAEERLQEVYDRIQELKQKKRDLEHVVNDNETRLQREKERVNSLKEKLTELRKDEKDLENDMKGANDQRDNLVGQLNSVKTVINYEKQKQEHQLDQLSQGAKLYKRLGLGFENIGNSKLKFSFDQIDPSDPDRIFFFILFVDEGDIYHVEQVEPSTGNIQELIDQLNEQNDFSGFVRAMRNKFKALCD